MEQEMFNLEELLDTMELFMSNAKKSSIVGQKGNKEAGQRSRLLSIELGKMLFKYRKASMKGLV